MAGARPGRGDRAAGMNRPDAPHRLSAVFGTGPAPPDRLPWPAAARVMLLMVLAFWGAVAAILLALIG